MDDVIKKLDLRNSKISIFIPTYNGSAYLHKTLQSIKEQTYKNFEVLLVDDCSTDNTVDILNEFKSNDSRFKVYVKEKNGGKTATSWNYILPKIDGEFIFSLSQDDLISVDLLEKMHDRYLETGAEIIVPDMRFYYEDSNMGRSIIGLNGDRSKIIDGKKALIESLSWNIHGFSLRMTKLYANELYPEDSFDSDEYMTRKIFSKSKSVAFSEGEFLYRQDNVNAITKVFSVKNYYTLLTLKRVLKLLISKDVSNNILVSQQYSLIRIYLELYSYFLSHRMVNKNHIKYFLEGFKENIFLLKKEHLLGVDIKYRSKLNIINLIVNNKLLLALAIRILKVKNSSVKLS